MRLTALVVATGLLWPASTFAQDESSGGFLKDVFDLRCSFTGASRSGLPYAFHVEIPKYFGRPRIMMVGANTFELKVVRLDATKIYATLDVRLGGWPDRADLMSFDFNRLTGDALIDYLHKPTDAEIKADPHPLPPDFMLILDDFSERGHCVKAKPAF